MEALVAAEQALQAKAHCRRKVFDVSGDVISNEGVAPHNRRAALTTLGVTVDALAIETDEGDLPGCFYENLMHGEAAFVMTASGFDDYPAQIKRKLQRETTRQLSGVCQCDHSIATCDHKACKTVNFVQIAPI